MRAQIQRTKLFRSLAVERDSIPLHSTPLDSIRIRIEFRFSSLSLSLSLSLFLSLSDSLTRTNATHARILASRADSLQLSSSFYSKNTVAFAITVTFQRYFARSRVPRGFPRWRRTAAGGGRGKEKTKSEKERKKGEREE